MELKFPQTRSYYVRVTTCGANFVTLKIFHSHLINCYFFFIFFSFFFGYIINYYLYIIGVLFIYLKYTNILIIIENDYYEFVQFRGFFFFSLSHPFWICLIKSFPVKILLTIVLYYYHPLLFLPSPLIPYLNKTRYYYYSLLSFFS